MRVSDHYDAIVIGAGIIGCCTAFELAKLCFPKTLARWRYEGD